MFVDYTDFNLLIIIGMTDNENQDDTKQMSDYAKQRAKHKEELDAKDQEIAQLKGQLKANKVAFFKDSLTKQGYKGNFDEFADKYADTLDVNEMLSLYAWMNGGSPVQQPQANPGNASDTSTHGVQSNGDSQPQIGPKSVIWQNPIQGDQPRDYNDLSVEEMKARGKQHPEIFNQ